MSESDSSRKATIWIHVYDGLRLWSHVHLGDSSYVSSNLIYLSRKLFTDNCRRALTVGFGKYVHQTVLYARCNDVTRRVT